MNTERSRVRSTWIRRTKCGGLLAIRVFVGSSFLGMFLGPGFDDRKWMVAVFLLKGVVAGFLGSSLLVLSPSSPLHAFEALAIGLMTMSFGAFCGLELLKRDCPWLWSMLVIMGWAWLNWLHVWWLS